MLLLVMDSYFPEVFVGCGGQSLSKNMFFSFILERIFCAIFPKLRKVEQEIKYGQTETYYQ